jgi:hypothetical protein
LRFPLLLQVSHNKDRDVKPVKFNHGGSQIRAGRFFCATPGAKQQKEDQKPETKGHDFLIIILINDKNKQNRGDRATHFAKPEK